MAVVSTRITYGAAEVKSAALFKLDSFLSPLALIDLL